MSENKGDLISREALLKCVGTEDQTVDLLKNDPEFMVSWKDAVISCVKSVIEIIKAAPTVDAQPVVHGEWVPHMEEFDEEEGVSLPGGFYQTGWQCSVCGRTEPDKEPYCNCGAKMDGGDTHV